MEPVRDAQRAGLCLLPPQSSSLLANRKVLALVSEGLPWMTHGERRLVDSRLPWTRVTVAGRTSWHGTEQELPGLALAARERFVLKKAVGTGRHNVLVGRHTGQETWERAVERAFREEDSVVQEYVEPALCSLELTDGDAAWTARVAPVLSPMLFGGRPGGCWARYVPEAAAGGPAGAAGTAGAGNDGAVRAGGGGPAQNAVLTWAG